MNFKRGHGAWLALILLLQTPAGVGAGPVRAVTTGTVTLGGGKRLWRNEPRSAECP